MYYMEDKTLQEGERKIYVDAYLSAVKPLAMEKEGQGTRHGIHFLSRCAHLIIRLPSEKFANP